uniref:Carbonic anhydrase n=1 Tax=Exaiptasia diaphana TaxID=2652724 RepID=A0A1B0Y784_EXADI|nr:alpha carbonic anhydrase 2 [Exaiptasia diaphana]
MLFIAVFLTALVSAATASGNWGYGKTQGDVYGPADWGHVSKDCNGRFQTPVDINTRLVRESDDHPLRVRFDWASGYSRGNLKNNGHSPTFTIVKGGASLRNPINGQIYRLAQFHLHFGCDDSVGSEHTVNGKYYPGELHLVFFNTKYGTIGNAAAKPDGLTVIGAFLRKGRGNFAMKKLAYKIRQISNEGAEAKHFGVYLGYLVPGLSTGSRDYYSYRGSLTTPGCYESVSWLVLGHPILADDHMFTNLRKLKAKHGKNPGKMCDNYRPIQPLNGRPITLYMDD